MRRVVRWLFAAILIAPLALTSVPSGAQSQAETNPLGWYVGRILFKSDRGGSEAIYAVNPDGSELQLVTDPNAGFYYSEALQRDLISTDGRYRLFVRKVGSDYQIWQQDTETLATAYITGGVPGADYDPAWAPDSRYVAYVSQVDKNDEIHLYDRQTGADRRLTRNNWEWDKHPTWSPDSSQIAFWSNRESLWKHIWLMNADGSAQHNISGWEKANDWDPVWLKMAPSAVSQTQTTVVPLRERSTGCTPAAADYPGKIVFKSDRDGTVAFFLLDPTSGSVCRIDDPLVGFFYAEAVSRDMLTPDERYRIFVKQWKGDYQIWLEDMQTRDTAFVAGGGSDADYDPVWAPDSRYIAYVSERDGDDEIFVFDRTTKQDKQLTNNAWEWDKKPTWSPDGTQIAFWSNRETGWKHLWLMAANGSDQHSVSGYGTYNDYDPVWFKRAPSPAPSAVLAITPRATAAPKPTVQAQTLDWYAGRILFKSDRGGSEAFYAVKPDGSELQLLTDPNVGFYYAEALQRDLTSTDGRYKLFVTRVGDDYQIWQQDTQTLATAYVVGGVPGADYDPAWAPDSRYVVYVSQVDENDEIHLYDRQTGEDHRLTRNNWEWDKHPTWSPDGAQIAFWSNRESLWKHIWLMNADGSAQHNISGWEKANDWDPVWVKMAPSSR